MANKLIIELELPVDVSDKDATGQFLTQQATLLVNGWKSVVETFKAQDVTVPTLHLRGAIKVPVNEELKIFRKTLIDYVLKFQPKVNVPQQMKVIGQLYALGHSAEFWTGLFDTSQNEYALTTWHTVKFRYMKGQVSEQEPVEMSTEEVNTLAERIKAYSKE